MSDTPAPLNAPSDSPSTPEHLQPAPKKRPRQSGRKFSRPIMSQTLTLDTGHAQRVMARGFRLTVASIGRLSTILYVLADEAQVDSLNQNISTWLDDFVTDVRATTQQLQQKLDDEGINGEPSYTNPQKVTISFGLPVVYKLITALSEFDLDGIGPGFGNFTVISR